MCSKKATKKDQVVKMHQHDEEEEDDDDGAATQRGKPNREKKWLIWQLKFVDTHGIGELDEVDLDLDRRWWIWLRC